MIVVSRAMLDSVRRRGRKGPRVGAAFLLAAVLAATCVRDARGADEMAAFFRIFLTDGTTLTSFGDFARVGDRVVFSLPLDEVERRPRLHLVSLPAARVDWNTTERYRKATRAAQYAATRGEVEFAILSAQVAELLSEIALTSDPAQRVALAR
jgi:hypothetical protein